MAKYKAYPEYKDSGVEWLGEIPSHWNILLGKNLFHSVRTYAYKSDEQLAASQKYGVIPQFLMMQLKDSKVMLALKGTDSFRHVEKNNFVISLRSFEGGIEYSKYSGCVSPAYTVLKNTKPISYSYYQYLFKCTPFISALQASTDSLRDGKSINYEQFSAIYLPFASIVEQNAIADVLIHETIKIDNLIEKQLQLIKLLKEKRQTLISHAVTKGLNPDVPMKHSGIDWCGVMPASWSSLNLKYIFSIQKNIAGQTGFDILSITQRGIVIKDTQSGDGQLSMDYSKYQRVYPGNFAMNHMDLLTGYVDISKYDGVTSPDYRVFHLKNQTLFHDKYYLYLLQNGYKQRLFFHLGQGSSQLGRWRLPTEAFNEINYPVPPYIEQKSIASHIDHETAKIDTLIEKQLQQIELLKERRTALISAAVTGKIDLRDWTPPASTAEASLIAEEALA